MALLEIKNLHVSHEETGKEIVKGVDLGVDLDRGSGRAVLPDAALLDRRSARTSAREARCDQKACPGHEHGDREPEPSVHVSPFREHRARATPDPGRVPPRPQR